MVEKLTGAWRFRHKLIGWGPFKRSYLVMQVEVYQRWLEPLGGSGHFNEMVHYVWRDAKIEDMGAGGAYPTGGGRIHG